jgi:hypothetical protein
MRKKDMYIEESPTAPQTFNEDISIVVSDLFFGKTIDTILEAASTEWWGMEKYLFLTKPIESEPKKRNGCHQITNLNKKLIKNILWIRMLY